MRLIRCRDQHKRPIEEFYGNLPEQHVDIGKAMLKLVKRLRAWPDERQVYLLTSHFHLCLLADDNSASPWFVKILAWPLGQGQMDTSYLVEYLMPERLAPWEGAFVSGRCGPGREDEAFQMILTAMDKSEGWTDTDPQGWKQTGRHTRRM